MEVCVLKKSADSNKKTKNKFNKKRCTGNCRQEKEKTASKEQAVQRLMGMLNYLAKFLPNMSEITEPLRNLMKN